MQNFKEAGLPEALSSRLEQIGFTEPTPVQAEAIPPALEGKDVLGSAQTGTGKTGAYSIPLIAKLLSSKEGNALILLPTRELAIQVNKTLQQFIGKSRIGTALLIGGDPMGKQIKQLTARYKPRLIVGTPGRVNDHLKRKSLKLDQTQFLVLDEVDRMLDMGFGIQLDDIAEYLTYEERQTLMFSATLPKNIERLTDKYLTDPVRVAIGTVDSPAEKVEQTTIQIKEKEKFDRLCEELNTRTGTVIIFSKTKANADDLAYRLNEQGHKADALHGDLRQNKRTRVIENYRKQKFRILVATDVAARGLDIPHIEHVINYALPQCPEDYIHRIGRTARAGAEGFALNFVAPSDRGKWHAIQKMLDPNCTPDFPADKNGGGRSRNRRGGKSSGGFGSNRNRSGGERRKSFGSSDRREGGERRKSFGSSERREGGERRKSFGSSERREGGERRKSFGSSERREGGERRKSFGSSERREGGERRKSFGSSERREGGERRKSFGKPSGDRQRSETSGNRGQGKRPVRRKAKAA